MKIGSRLTKNDTRLMKVDISPGWDNFSKSYFLNPKLLIFFLFDLYRSINVLLYIKIKDMVFVL